MKAATPPAFCASAIKCKVKVVLPEDSGPKISITRPRGKPPTPSAASSEIEPLEITATGTMAPDPRRRTAPLPNCLFEKPERARQMGAARGASIERRAHHDDCHIRALALD